MKNLPQFSRPITNDSAMKKNPYQKINLMIDIECEEGTFLVLLLSTIVVESFYRGKTKQNHSVNIRSIFSFSIYAQKYLQ